MFYGLQIVLFLAFSLLASTCKQLFSIQPEHLQPAELVQVSRIVMPFAWSRVYPCVTGVVKSQSPMMLVMEIARLGPLHKYLKKNK